MKPMQCILLSYFKVCTFHSWCQALFHSLTLSMQWVYSISKGVFLLGTKDPKKKGIHTIMTKFLLDIQESLRETCPIMLSPE